MYEMKIKAMKLWVEPEHHDNSHRCMMLNPQINQHLGAISETAVGDPILTYANLNNSFRAMVIVQWKEWAGLRRRKTYDSSR